MFLYVQISVRIVAFHVGDTVFELLGFNLVGIKLVESLLVICCFLDGGKSIRDALVRFHFYLNLNSEQIRL